LPVPVSSWINTTEPTGATLATSANNAWNFGLDPIKFRRVISLVLYECGRSTISINQRASRFALSQKSHAILTGQSQLLEVKNDAAIFSLRRR
jgi:hypothetical protein